MRVLYDHQVFTWQNIGGISRYFVELMSHVSNDFDVSVKCTDNEYFNNRLKSNLSTYSFGYFKGKGRMYNFVNKFNSLYLLKKSKFDIFHPTYYDTYFLSEIKKPYVVTVYDMIHEKFSDMFQNDNVQYMKKKVVTNAAKIIAISNQTKKDIIDIYGLDDRKIDVIHLGHSIDIENVCEIEGIPSKFILFVGARSGYKNFARFLEAFSVLLKHDPELSLICTGGFFTAEEQAKITSLHLTKHIIQFFASDAQLAYLYSKAQCFVFPSIYEGFGIPILEAFASGCPIALSNSSCFPEVAQTAGCYFDPYDIESIVSSVSRLLYDIPYRENLVAEGYRVLKQYSWQKMGDQTVDVYRSIL